MRLRETQRGRGVLGFDLENRPLAYWYEGETTSEITAFGWKWSDAEGVETMLLLRTGRFDVGAHNTRSADWVYRTFRDALAAAGLVYGHNIRRHDLGMFNAGLQRLQLTPLGPVLTTDTLKDQPRSNGRSRSLESLVDEYQLDGEKPRMSAPKWERANRLTPDGVELARNRVTWDVLLQERLRAKLLELNLLGPPRTWRP